MKDKHLRKINYMRVSLTNRCNLKCIYCMPEKSKCSNITPVEETLTGDDFFNVIKSFAELGLEKVRFTGGEPLLFKDLIPLIKKTAELESIKDISLTTNGILLADKLEELKDAGLSRINISLDTLKSDRFKEITRGGNLQNVLDSIEKYYLLGMKNLKINTLIIKGINDDEINDLVDLTKENPINLRFIELMPLGEGNKFYKDGFISSQELRDRIKVKRNLIKKDNLYQIEGYKGKIDFISPLSDKFCATCDKIRLTANAKLKPCLHSASEINLRDSLYNQVELSHKIKDAINSKPLKHHLDTENKSRCDKNMYQIGG